MSWLRLVIFDMDGLMIDSEGTQRVALNRALAPSGVQVGEEEWRGFVGRRAIDIFSDLKAKYNIAAELDELLASKNQAYTTLLQEQITPLPGLYDLVDGCRRAGLQMAVASSSVLEDVRTVIRALKLEEEFAALVSGEDISRGKPYPDIFLETARRLDVGPQHCVVLEDTAHGVQAARRAGMLCVAVPNSFTEEQEFTGASMVVNSLADIDVEALKALKTNGR